MLSILALGGMLAGATLTPERYACAVSVNGVSDPEDMLKDANRGGKSSMPAEWWGKSMGSDMDALRKISPLRLADQVRIPILLLHGSEDSVVPIDLSRDMNKKLLAARPKANATTWATKPGGLMPR